jgi:hypothetical protein
MSKQLTPEEIMPMLGTDFEKVLTRIQEFEASLGHEIDFDADPYGCALSIINQCKREAMMKPQCNCEAA